MAQIVVILWVGPLLLGLGHYQASRNLARKRWGPRAWRSQGLGTRSGEEAAVPEQCARWVTAMVSVG